MAAFGLLDGAWWATLASVRLDERAMLSALGASSLLLLQRWRALSMLFCFSADAL